MPIKHAFVNPKIEPGDATLIRPSNWNDDHNYPAFTVFAMQFGGDPYATRNVGAGLTDPYGASYYSKVDLTNALQARVVGAVTQNVSAVAAKIACQYSPTGAVWDYLDGVDGPYITLTPLGDLIGALVTIAVAARADVWLRWVTRDGDGSALQWHHHYLQVR